MNALDHLHRGNTLIQEGDPLSALTHFNVAVQLDPLLADAHFGVGLCCYQLGDNAKAATALTECLRLEQDVSGVATACAIRALARNNAGDRRGAMDDYQEAVSRNANLVGFFQSQLCVGTTQVLVIAEAYPARFSSIVERLTRA